MPAVHVDGGRFRLEPPERVGRWKSKKGFAMTQSAWLPMVCIGLVAASTLPAQEFRHERTLKNLPEVFAIAFSPDGRTLAAGCQGSEEGSIVLWDVKSAK